MLELQQAIKRAVKELFDVDIEPELTRPEEQFGDYSTNVAMQLGGQVGKASAEIAKELQPKILELSGAAQVQIAGAGFINIWLTDETLTDAMLNATNLPKPLKEQKILVEFGDPNPFKEMHIGHLYSYIAGEGIARLFEVQGAKVERLSYHGDVGRHVARAIWGIKHSAGKTIGELYAAGAQADEQDNAAKAEIDGINEHVYKRDNDVINQLYDQGKQQSFAEFDKILDLLSIKIDRRYLESESMEPGRELVMANIGKVFQESDGAVVYRGEQDGLHTRVFITSRGLPTYETKDLGLAQLKDKDYPEAARSIIDTGVEQAEYFKVMLTALAKIKPELAAKINHTTHGFVNLSTGKMSSRKGGVFTAQRLLDDVAAAFGKAFDKGNPAVEIGAIKYGFLKHRLGSEITYDPEESVSLEGNSGPYLQYAFARANSILQKSTVNSQQSTSLEPRTSNLEPGERSLVRKISEYPEVVVKATAELMPHHICTYLYELAQNFNRFYEQNQVVGNPRQDLRLSLVSKYAAVLKSGLNILNIDTPERM